MAAEPIQGRCPACGAEELHRGFQGRVVCGNTLCEQQDAVHDLLTDPELTEHLIKVTPSVRRFDSQGNPGPESTDWTLRHPLVERLDDALFGCELALYLNAMHQANEELAEGLHRVTVLDTGGWRFEQVKR